MTDPRFAKAAIVVLDGVGVGGAPDAADYGDDGSDTLGHTADAVGGLELPHFRELGLGNLTTVRGVDPVESATGSWGRMQESAAGKDTTTGHWEIAGVVLHERMPTYPNGFPPEIMDRFAEIAGVPGLSNTVASGTAIIAEYGEEHQRTGRPIVYTSADSVFQIAAHEKTVPLQELYRICREMRRVLAGPHAVGRVIARPFVGVPGAYERTNHRRDFSLEPPGATLLDRVAESGREVVSVGKIDDIFAGRGVTRSFHVLPNQECVDATIRALGEIDSGLVFTNLIEFDMNFGHRNDPPGMAGALRALDARMPELLEAAGADTILLFTADHGNDPTTPSTDHSREEVPLVVWTGGQGVPLGTRRSFADVAATLADNFGLEPPAAGTSFLSDLPGGAETRTIPS
ncbi:MAG: phosphopentomutase [Gemmatimonadota bacterium]|nr:MAG: phosphopentomutase [Gemmatimonadota bacterium]